MPKGKNQAPLKRTSRFRSRFRNWGYLLLLLPENQSRHHRLWSRLRIRVRPLLLLFKNWSGRRHFWLGASPHSPAQGPEQASSSLGLTLLSPPGPDIKAKSPLGEVVAQPLTTLPITVWNPPPDKAKSPLRGTVELKRKKSKSKADVVKDSLLSNAELAAGAVSSILKESDIGRSKELPIDEALALSFQGFASVSL